MQQIRRGVGHKKQKGGRRGEERRREERSHRGAWEGGMEKSKQSKQECRMEGGGGCRGD